MQTTFLLFVHLAVTLLKLIGPGGAKGVVAESLALKHQLLVLNRGRKRAPNLKPLDRFLMGLWSFVVRPGRIDKIAAIVSTATLYKFHDALKKRKYRRLFSSQGRKRPGPKGPSQELIDAIVEMKRRNPRFGCPRIAQQITKAFGVQIDKDVVRRVLAKRYRPPPGGGGPSWLTLLGHTKDSLWSIDLFRCESILLRTHWVMLVLDQYSREIIGFAVVAGPVDGAAVCRMFNQVIVAAGADRPKRLSSDNDPLFLFHRWKANLRIREIEEIKTVPHVPWSHPFVERLIGTVRREYLDQVFFWNDVDLERKLGLFKNYYNEQRTHSSLGGDTPTEMCGQPSPEPIKFDKYGWQEHCAGLFQLPVAA